MITPRLDMNIFSGHQCPHEVLMSLTTMTYIVKPVKQELRAKNEKTDTGQQVVECSVTDSNKGRRFTVYGTIFGHKIYVIIDWGATNSFMSMNWGQLN